MTAKLFSLPAFRHAVLKEGMGLAAAARLARHVATELHQDGMLDPGPTPEGAAVASATGTDLHTAQAAVNAAAKNGIRPVLDPAEVEVFAAEARAAQDAPAPESSAGHDRSNPHPQVHDIGAPYGYSVGAKYDDKLDIKDIAALVRAEIKDRVKKGTLPKGKYGVRISRYSGGRSMTIKVSDIDPSFGVINPAYLAEERQNPHAYRYENSRYMPQFSKVLADLKAIATAYRYDRSESMVDYFDTNFYLHVDADWQWEKALTDAAKASA